MALAMLALQELVRQLRRRRAVAGLTQQQLASSAGVSQSLVAKLERGRLNPSYETVRLLIMALEERERGDDADAAALMRAQPVAAAPGEKLGIALERMKRGGYSQLPVVDDGTPVGSLSEGDILARLEQGETMEAIRRRPVREVMGASFPTVDPATPRRVLVELLRDNDAVLVVRQGRLAGVVTKSDLW